MSVKTVSVLDNPIEIAWLNLWPVTQVYGVLFNEKKEILVLKRPEERFTLPGGKPETGETIYQSLEREAMEEANVRVSNLVLLGTNKVEDPQNPDPKFKTYYQLRLIGTVEEELPREVDPATGELMERIYCNLSKLNEILQWGLTGDEMVKQIEKFLRYK